jgi:WD40 repeat protein
LTGHTGFVASLAIGRIGDRDVIVSGSDDHTVRMWDAASGQPRGEPLTGHTDLVRAVMIGRISKRDVIVSASFDHTLRVWDLAGGRSMVIDLLGAAEAVAVTEDGNRLCVAAGHTICMFEA